MESDSLSLSPSKDESPSAERSTSTSSADVPSDDDMPTEQLLLRELDTNLKKTFKEESKAKISHKNVCEEKSKKIYKFKCKFSGTICDVLTRRGWVEQEDEFSDDWDIFWCDVNQLRDLFISSNTKIQDHQRISHFRSCFEICRKNLMVKNLKRLQSRIKKTFGKEESEKLNFFPTTYILPMDHKFFLQEFKRRPAGYWIIKPAAGAQGRGIVIFSQLAEYNSWRKQYHDALKQLQALSCPAPEISPESVAPYIALSATQLNRSPECADEENKNNDEDNSDDESDAPSSSFDTSENQEKDPRTKNKGNEKEHQDTSNNVSSGSDTSDRARLPTIYDSESPENGSPVLESGITVNENPKEVSPDSEKPPSEQTKNLRADVFVLQRYIDDPYLIGGRKFDLRLFVLVTSYKPLKAWLYRDGFARFCSESFSMSCTQNMYVHLTNVAVQRTSENYDEDTDLKWPLKKFRSFLQSRHGRQEVFNFMTQVDTIIVRTLQSILNVVIPDRNSFELYGFDVIIDSKVKPWLLEVNASPAFTPSSEEDYRLKCCLIDDTMNVLDVQGRRTGKEKQVGAYDMFWDNGPVYADPNCHYEGSDKKMRKPKLNTFLGCESNRLEKLRQMYKAAHTLHTTRKHFERQGSQTIAPDGPSTI